MVAERFDMLELAGSFFAKIESKIYSMCHEDHFEV